MERTNPFKRREFLKLSSCAMMAGIVSCGGEKSEEEKVQKRGEALPENQFTQMLEGTGKEFHILKSGAFTFHILTHGARILSAMPDDRTNHLWVPPRLENILKDDPQIPEGERWNLGGNRLWLAPERNMYYRDPVSFGDWFVPKWMDPANYKVSASMEKMVHLKTDMVLVEIMKKLKYEGEMGRDIMAVTPSTTNAGLLRIRDWAYIRAPKDSPLEANLWSLTQTVPGTKDNPGVVFAPVKKDAKPIGNFGEIPLERCHVRGDHLRFLIDAEEIYKLAIAPEDIRFQEVKGKKAASIAYLNIPAGSNEGLLIVKTCTGIPLSQDDLTDPARENPNLRKGSLQSYNNGPGGAGGGWLKFGEIEQQLSPIRYNEDKDGFYGESETLLEFSLGTKDMLINQLNKKLNITATG